VPGEEHGNVTRAGSVIQATDHTGFPPRRKLGSGGNRAEFVLDGRALDKPEISAQCRQTGEEFHVFKGHPVTLVKSA